jgi:hypothetical protein
VGNSSISVEPLYTSTVAAPGTAGQVICALYGLTPTTGSTLGMPVVPTVG